MARTTQLVKLTKNEIGSLTNLLTRGATSARTITRAHILDLLHRGQRPSAVATTLQITPQTVFNIKQRYLTKGLDSVLCDRPRAGRPIQIDGKQRAQLTTLACSTPPEGRAWWTLWLLADQVVELGYCESLSHTAARQILKKELRPHSKKTWCIGIMDAQFIARMEQILWLYGLPYNPCSPVICFDERPCFLVGEVVEGLAMKAGQIARQHLRMPRTAHVRYLLPPSPQTGKRLAQVFDQRTKREYALFMRELAAKFPEAEKIRIVQDNLNTHNLSSFYETSPKAEEAFALSQGFEFYYTPKSASWLNMIEIEFSALSKQ